jgi:pentatricopeptide repeat protein
MMEEAKLNKYAQPTEVTYRYILDYFASRADEKNFFIVMDEMKQLNITMGIITYTMILRLRRYQLDEAKFQQALEEIASLNLTATTHTFNELIELYLAQGKKEKAKNVFDQLYALNLRASPGTYDPFFRYYAKVGDDIKMLEMFDMMIRDNIKPSKACQITRTYKPSFLEVPLAISTQLTEILFPTKIAVMDALINDGDLSRARIFLETIRNWRGPAYVLPVKEIYISLVR